MKRIPVARGAALVWLGGATVSVGCYWALIRGGELIASILMA